MSENNAQDKQYYWDVNDEIPMKGFEFQLFLNGLRQILSTPEAQNILLLAEMAKAAERMLKEAIEKGVVKDEPPKPQPPVMKPVE